MKRFVVLFGLATASRIEDARADGLMSEAEAALRTFRKEVEYIVNRPALFTVPMDMSREECEEDIEEARQDLGKLEISKILDSETVEQLLVEAKEEVANRYLEHVGLLTRDEFPSLAHLRKLGRAGKISLHSFKEEARRLADWPLNRMHYEKFDPEYFDGRIAKARDALERLAITVDPSVDPAKINEARVEAETRIVEQFERRKRLSHM